MINSVSGLPAIYIDEAAAIQTKMNNAQKKQEMLTSNNSPFYSDKQDKMNGFINNEPSNTNLYETAIKLQDLLGEENMMIEFSKDKETNKMIMKLIDNNTNEVIQQFPPEIALKIARIVQSTLGNSLFTNVKV